jgi:hypothetical protein
MAAIKVIRLSFAASFRLELHGGPAVVPGWYRKKSTAG